MIPGLSQFSPRRRSGRHQQSSEESPSSSRTHHYHQHSHHHHHYHHHQHHHPGQRPRISRTQPELQTNPAVETSASSSRPTNLEERLLHRRMPFLMQRRPDSDAHRIALEARGRLDERLREVAFLGRRNPESTLPRLAQYYFNALFSDEEEASAWDDEHDWEASLSEWLAGGVPAFRESWRPEWMNELPSTAIRGLSKAAVNALPREVYGQKSKLKGAPREEQVDCSVCLEQFVAGETLLRLPCKHKFHPACLTPWLESHEQCPYCRAHISVGERESEDNLLSWLEAFETGMSRMRFNVTN